MVRRLAPPAGSDAELLDCYRLTRDEAAFAALVRRHAQAVRAVARARLANAADADDVCQATFLVLARDAHLVRESVAGWLVRVAHLTALQHRRNLARRRTEPLPEHLEVTADPADAAAAREAAAMVAEELVALPDKLRAVLALCALDGLTAAVAAERLGVPKGTVDTRLATAKRRLAERLTRRGLAAGSLAAVTAAPVSAEFVDGIARAACSYAVAGSAVPTAVSLLADGVRPTMSSTARLFALGMVAAAVTGTAGTALYHAGPGDDKPQAQKPPPAKPADPKPAATLTVNAPDADPPAKPRLTAESDVRALLAAPSMVNPSVLSLGSLLSALEEAGLDTRIDLPALLRARVPDDQLNTLRDTKLRSFGGRGTTWADLLTDATAAITWGDNQRMTYWVSGNRVVVGPAYRTPSVPGSGRRNDFRPALPLEDIMEQLVGPPVSLAIDGLSLDAAVKKLRALTGANIVIDQRAKDKLAAPVAGTFDDVRLLTVLQVLADQAGLKPVTLNNVYYLTDPVNAAPLQKLADADLHGPPQMGFGGGLGGGPTITIPAGFVTDGYQYFPRTADMKPVDLRTLGALGGAGFGGGTGPAIQPLPGTQPVAAPPAEKK